VADLIARRRHREALGIVRQLHAESPDDNEVATLLRDLRVATHWTMLPMWPMQRFGWVGAAVIWGGAIVAMQLARSTGGPGLSGSIAVVVLLYIAYSWLWPGTLRKLLRD
jgi:hypothetical protein